MNVPVSKRWAGYAARTARRWLVAACWVYFTILFSWCLLYFASGDRISAVALINNLAVYLFFPVLPVAFVAPFLGRREIWAGWIVAALVFGVLWGELFVPDLRARRTEADVLTVMTYNVLARHAQTDPILDVILAEEPDVVFVQELNPQVARAFQAELQSQYPYQILEPRDDVIGMGVISRFPLRSTDQALSQEWVGDPQLISLDWQGNDILLINFHMFPSGIGASWQVEYVYRARESQARALADFVRTHVKEGPVIAAGDANVTDLSDAYRILRLDLNDTWRDAGFGLGHTFPGSDIAGSSRPRIAGRLVPMWLARIDYIFVSPQWMTIGSRMARFDGVSDHRGVVTELVLLSHRQ